MVPDSVIILGSLTQDSSSNHHTRVYKCSSNTNHFTYYTLQSHGLHLPLLAQARMTTAVTLIIVFIILWLLVDVLQHEFRIRRERKRFGKDIYIYIYILILFHIKSTLD